MFDLVTFAPLARAHAAEDADAIFDPASRRVFSCTGENNYGELHLKALTGAPVLSPTRNAY